MKNFKSLFIVAVLLCVGISTANAQFSPVSFGIKGGVNLANFSGDAQTDVRFKYQFGTVLQVNLPAGLFILSGVEYTAKGAKMTYTGSDDKEYTANFNPQYLQVPVRLGYKMSVLPTINIKFSGGSYYAYGIAGKAKFNGPVTLNNRSYENGDKVGIFSSNGLNYDRQDFGVGAGVGIEFLGIVGLDLGYDFGLKNISGDDAVKVRNQNAYLTASLKF